MGKKSSLRNQIYGTEPHRADLGRLVAELATNVETGLTNAQARCGLRDYGENKLNGEGVVRWYNVLLKQCSNAMILVLVLAMALSFGVSDYIEGSVITAVIFLNVLIGFYQEYNAEKKMDALRNLSSPSAAVLRDGHIDNISSAEVVPGDVVLLKTGGTVPADLRLIDVMNLECDEKILTGEALPVHKDPFAQNWGGDVPVGDRINMVYSSSTVTKGRGRGIVVKTGMWTEIGKIAASLEGKKKKENRSMSRKKHGNLQPVKGASLRTWDGVGKFLGLTEGTPLQIKLSKLAYVLLLVALVLVLIVFAVNKFNITGEVAIYAISIGIAIIPESLIAVLTITMVVGMTQMRKKKVVIRQLSALEALGGVTNICSDKTGTLTQGNMITRKAWLPGVGIYSVRDSQDFSDPTDGMVTLGPAPISRAETLAEREQRAAEQDQKRSAGRLKFDVPEEKFEKDARAVEYAEMTQDSDVSSRMRRDYEMPPLVPELDALLQAVALCNIATVRHDASKNEWQTTGDPTEIALQVFAHRWDQGNNSWANKGWQEVTEFPFDSSAKRMTVIYADPNVEKVDNLEIFTKGAVERVLDLCVRTGVGNKERTMADEDKQTALEQMGSLADKGLRVLAIARATRLFPNWKEGPFEYERTDIEKDLTFVGLVGLYDPPRLETRDAVRECFDAGISVHMLTGDHKATASAIAKEVGILPRTFAHLSAEVSESLVKTAAEFDSMTDTEIDAMPELPLVIARCAPDTKTRMIKALHRRKLYVAMTGDGVNDAPSLKAADVGIAMGMGGSDVAKGASDILLTDDNFASIVHAIEEGRRMFDNIQKFILHLLVSNVGEVILLIAGLGFKDESGTSVFPLSPLQILWINMLTSSFPAFGLGREKASQDVMTRPPHDTKRGVFTIQIIVDMLVYGLAMGICTLLTFVSIVYGAGKGDLGDNCNAHYNSSCNVVFRARAAVFAELTWLILVSAWEFKSIRRSLFRLSPTPLGTLERAFPFFHDAWENKFLFFAVVLGFLSVFPTVYIPGLNTQVFKHGPITWEWALAFGAIFVFVLGIEAWKFAKRYFGWFNGGESDCIDRTDRLGLWRQALTFATTLTGTNGDAKFFKDTGSDDGGHGLV